MQKESFYFPHFCNARHDRKIQRMRSQLGIEGYGIYFMLLEVLREQHDLHYPMEDVDLLANEFNTSEQKLRTVICNYQLFDVSEDEKFFSPKMLVYLEPYFKMKQQRIDAGKASALKRISNDRSTTVQQSKVNESKVNESKVNESKVKKSKENYLERKNSFLLSLENYRDKLSDEFDKFFNYWSESSDEITMRYEKEKFFAIPNRISYWNSNLNKFQKKSNNFGQSINEQPGRLTQMMINANKALEILNNEDYDTTNFD